MPKSQESGIDQPDLTIYDEQMRELGAKLGNFLHVIEDRKVRKAEKRRMLGALELYLTVERNLDLTSLGDNELIAEMDALKALAGLDQTPQLS